METVSYLRDQLQVLRRANPGIYFGSLSVQLANVKDEDWENNWKQYYQPLPIGQRLLVVPEWLHPENPENRVEVLLDPGMIFGTGAHASTQMCMRELEHYIRGGERVLDLGSGSGILSITALLLGAASAVGVDIDPKAEDIAGKTRDHQLMPTGLPRDGDVIDDRSVPAVETDRHVAGHIGLTYKALAACSVVLNQAAFLSAPCILPPVETSGPHWSERVAGSLTETGRLAPITASPSTQQGACLAYLFLSQ